jgi:hypothetical protein
MNATPIYEIRKISDPRSRGACYWFEIFVTDANGRHGLATCDTREEANELLAAIRNANANQERRT